MYLLIGILIELIIVDLIIGLFIYFILERRRIHHQHYLIEHKLINIDQLIDSRNRRFESLVNDQPNDTDIQIALKKIKRLNNQISQISVNMNSERISLESEVSNVIYREIYVTFNDRRQLSMACIEHLEAISHHHDQLTVLKTQYNDLVLGLNIYYSGLYMRKLVELLGIRPHKKYDLWTFDLWGG